MDKGLSSEKNGLYCENGIPTSGIMTDEEGNKTYYDSDGKPVNNATYLDGDELIYCKNGKPSSGSCYIKENGKNVLKYFGPDGKIAHGECNGKIYENGVQVYTNVTGFKEVTIDDSGDINVKKEDPPKGKYYRNGSLFSGTIGGIKYINGVAQS